MSALRRVARPMLASMFIVGGVTALRNAAALAPAASRVTDRVMPVAQRVAPSAPLPTSTTALVRANAVAQVVAGLGLATGRAPRTSAAVLAATLVPTTLAGHAFWTESDPATRNNQLVHFLKNVSMFGGLLLAAGDTAGQPGLGWRTAHAARTAKKEAKRFARSARREAKLVRAQAF